MLMETSVRVCQGRDRAGPRLGPASATLKTLFSLPQALRGTTKRPPLAARRGAAAAGGPLQTRRPPGASKDGGAGGAV